MQRLLTTVTLAAWSGYGAVSAATHGVEAFASARAGMAGAPLSAWLPRFVVDEAIATSFLAVAGLFGAALFLLHAAGGRRAVAAAERLSLCALALVGLMLFAGTGPVAGPPVSAVTLILLLAASVAALALDRLITPDEEEAFDLDTFEAGIAAVAEAMARQTRLYTPQRDDRTGR
jgi:hypothetical protein